MRIDRNGAYANLVLPKILSQSRLAERDRAFATELVYGATRHRRSCDWFIDRFALGDMDPNVRAALRIGVYQLRILGTPAHAGVSATVDAVPRKARGFVNAILRKVVAAEDAWPSDAVRLSYPDWIFERLCQDLGPADAMGAMESMNGAASVVERSDGYIQDPASQWVVSAVGASSGERILDLCAAPGGKATALASIEGVSVVAADSRAKRAGLVKSNRDRLDISPQDLAVVIADGTAAPFAPQSFDRVLVDAPCSGLGSLRRRADARWRIDADAPDRLARLQVELLNEAATLVRSGGTLTYSVCTLTRAETVDVADAFLAKHPGWAPLPTPDHPWKPWGSGAILLPQVEGTDGMALFGFRAP